MSSTNHPGFFDIAEHTRQLTRMGDPLGPMDGEAFRTDLNQVLEKPRESNAGAKQIDVVL